MERPDRLDTARIAELLEPYLETALTADQLAAVRAHLDLLVRWNAKTNLTAVRDPEEMVRRHFGESFFAASHLVADSPRHEIPQTSIDLGSGAGFPGIPLAIYAPHLEATLVESQNKKATFLKEVVRALALKQVKVMAVRGESLQGKLRAHLVTMRAVEKFSDSATLAATLLQPEGRLALLIGAPQVEDARRLLPVLSWHDPIAVPATTARVLLVGQARVR